LYIRRNEGGRITGATFIDHETRCVLNGSRLGKEDSANALQERFGVELESGAGYFGHGPELREPLQPTPPIVPSAPETRQSLPPQKRTVPRKRKPKMGL
ncbi:MAG: mobilization protein, partial [Bacteroidales bacterium]|nr:mobilization protein [Bacteroidales bacterium]